MELCFLSKLHFFPESSLTMQSELRFALGVLQVPV